MKRRGKDKRKKRVDLSPEMVESICRRLIDGEDAKLVAHDYNVSLATIYNYRKQHLEQFWRWKVKELPLKLPEI